MRLHHHDGWMVRVDKDEFFLTDQEYQLLKKAALVGKTMVWFDELALSVPHISFIEKVRKQRYSERQLLEPEAKNYSEKIKELKKKLYEL